MKIKQIILAITVFINLIFLQMNIFRGIFEIILIGISIWLGISIGKNKFGKVGETVEKSTSPQKYPEAFIKQNGKE